MRIVLVNWAHIWDGASNGGGVNGYCQALALELIERGHHVISLCSGTTYTPGPEPDTIGACEIRRHEDWLGVRVFEVINSPVLAPSAVQFDDPEGEVGAPELESRIRELFVMLRPDIVHWHNIEGFSAGCVGAGREPHADWPGAKTLYSLHNYHPICPQVYLMQGHTEPCFDAQGGLRCATCVDRPSPSKAKLRRANAYTAQYRETHPESRPPKPRRAPAPPITNQVIGEVKRWVRGEPMRPPAPAPPTPAPIELPGAEVGSPVQATDAWCDTARDEEVRGQARSIVDKEHHGFVPTPEDPGWKPLLNVIQPEPRPGETNAYAHRRAAMVGMLNGCDRVLSVSQFVQNKYVSMGMRADRASVMPIGSRMNTIVDANRELAFAPTPFAQDPDRPISLVFLGFNNHYKGLHVLADALELLTPDYLRRVHLVVHAHNSGAIQWRFARLSPRLADLTYHDAYDYSDIPWILGGKDLVVVPSIWWDNAPQTVFESFACGLPVLGADLGGIPDYVKHGHNGLLFRGNDRYDLARRLAELVRDPRLLDRLRANVRPPKSIEDHAIEMAALYEELRADPGTSPTSPDQPRMGAIA